MFHCFTAQNLVSSNLSRVYVREMSFALVLVYSFCNSLSSTPELFSLGSVIKTLILKLSSMYAVYLDL